MCLKLMASVCGRANDNEVIDVVVRGSVILGCCGGGIWQERNYLVSKSYYRTIGVRNSSTHNWFGVTKYMRDSMRVCKNSYEVLLSCCYGITG